MFEEEFRDFRKFEDEINRAFADMKIHLNSRLKSDLRVPPIDLREEKNNIIASIEIPGIEEKDIKLKIHPERVEMKVGRKVDKKVQTERFIHNERKYRAFYRSFPLPKKVIPGQSRHTYKDGVLKIIMPKTN